MTHRFCHRCQAELPSHDEGTLIFCSHCGAAQVLLSEDLQTQAELQLTAAADGSAAASATRDPRSMVWPGAFRCVLLAGAIAGVLKCISIPFPPVILMTWLWAVISPVVVIGMFQTRFPLAPISTGFGARLGLLTGLSIGLALNLVNVAELMVRRFGIHNMREFDGQWTAIYAQFQATMVAQSGPSVLPIIQVLSIPEFRAGIFLGLMAFGIVVLLVVTTAGGAFAGFVRSRSKA